MQDDISDIFIDQNYSQPVLVEGVPMVEQKISCGYAVIEMISKWQGGDVDEELLFTQNNKNVSTAFGNGFEKEMNK